MPYKSTAQERWAHTIMGMKALGKKKVSEWDKMSKGLKLPKHVKKTKKNGKR